MDSSVRHLVIVLGDQLNSNSSAFDGFDPRADAVLMVEAAGEATHVWSHKARIVLFLSAMRHFRQRLEGKGYRVWYHELKPKSGQASLAEGLQATAGKTRPQRLIMTEPGEFRVREELLECAETLGIPLEIRPDRHFICSDEQFAEHARGRKQLRMEYFYRQMRRETGVLMDGDEPIGGQWNYDWENRQAFGADGPGEVPAPIAFDPDPITRGVIRLVNRRFRDHPGELSHFTWPVTRADALEALADFVRHRLPRFGAFQDAMWSGEPWLYHSHLSTCLNLKLLHPREVVDEVEQTYYDRAAPLNAVEGFIRQVLGWREYTRGVYRLFMPDYLERNELRADAPLPEWYWTGETDMRCLSEVIGQTMKYGYAHHIQRLMVTGLFALLLGVEPKQVHAWYLAVYVDAVEWVELPNTLGMSQYADGGVMASKPYVATGRYIHRMSDYCEGCRYKPSHRSGEDACPFTVLYWSFLNHHRDHLKGNRRMSLQLRQIDRLDSKELASIERAAKRIRKAACS